MKEEATVRRSRAHYLSTSLRTFYFPSLASLSWSDLTFGWGRGMDLREDVAESAGRGRHGAPGRSQNNSRKVHGSVTLSATPRSLYKQIVNNAWVSYGLWPLCWGWEFLRCHTSPSPASSISYSRPQGRRLLDSSSRSEKTEHEDTGVVYSKDGKTVVPTLGSGRGDVKEEKEGQNRGSWLCMAITMNNGDKRITKKKDGEEGKGSTRTEPLGLECFWKFSDDTWSRHNPWPLCLYFICSIEGRVL